MDGGARGNEDHFPPSGKMNISSRHGDGGMVGWHGRRTTVRFDEEAGLDWELELAPP